MQEVIKDIGEQNEYILFGTDDSNTVRESDRETKIVKTLGGIDYVVLSPAQYVSEDIENETDDERYRRIHEQCSVIKFSYGDETQRSILIAGDADKAAWKEHITEYHKEKLPSDALGVVHHGSRTFFKENEDDEDVYEDHIQAIDPTYLIISAPKQSEGPHGHPHDDAMEIYRKYAEDDNIIHLGEKRECVIIDITAEGTIEVKTDQDLVKEYGFESEDNNSGDSGIGKSAFISAQVSRIDRKPMG